MSHLISIIPQEKYQFRETVNNIMSGLNNIHFNLHQLSNKRVLIKPNMIGPFSPNVAATTHPIVVKAIIEIVQNHGGTACVGDSPSGVYSLDHTWIVTGIKAVCQDMGAEMISFEGAGSDDYEGLLISNAAMNVDMMINVPKLKTHSLTLMTAGIKNLFGCVSGMLKQRYHVRYKKIHDFSGMLVKLANSISPQLTIVDGIVGMQGNGPSAGQPIDVGHIIIGDHVFATDYIAAQVMGIAPSDIEMLCIACEQDVLEAKSIQLCGDIASIPCVPFVLPITQRKKWRTSKWLEVIVKWLFQYVCARAHINHVACKRCYLCEKACPVQAIGHLSDHPLQIDYGKCIDCFCCHEVCPHLAIDLRDSGLLKILRYLGWEKERNGN